MQPWESQVGSDSRIRSAVVLAGRAMFLFAVIGAMLLACAGVALAQAVASPPQGAGGADAERYIVVLENSVGNPSQVASGIEQRQEDLEVGFVYTDTMEGFSATIPEEELAAVRANPQVDYVEPDRRMHAVYQTLPWGINRIDADISSTRAGDGSGVVSGVNAYIIDTGIKRHTDLNVVGHVNFHGGKNTDCDGHGTHVAGTVAARDNSGGVVGVAPGAPLTGVKVVGCDGSGSVANVIAGIDWVTANADKPAIANLSLETRASRVLDEAVKISAASGVFYSVAAGNKGKDACE